MPEHRIRLRGGWQCHDPSDDLPAARPLTLPIHWPVRAPGPLRLVRRFGLPAIDPTKETVALVAEHVPGLLRVRLNDELLLGPDGMGDVDSFEIRELRARNELVLEVDPAGASAGTSSPEGWGHVALVVRS